MAHLQTNYVQQSSFWYTCIDGGNRTLRQFSASDGRIKLNSAYPRLGLVFRKKGISYLTCQHFRCDNFVKFFRDASKLEQLFLPHISSNLFKNMLIALRATWFVCLLGFLTAARFTLRGCMCCCTLYTQTDLLKRIPWSIIFQKLRAPHLVKKFPAFYETWPFFSACTRTRHVYLHWARSNQSMLRYHFSNTHFNIILPSTPRYSKCSSSSGS